LQKINIILFNINKKKYAQKQQLGGIMFWVLGCDVPKNGLLEAIFKASKGE
jgi:GH18 family chitinase